MIMAGITGKAVPIPMDRLGYEKLLQKLIKNSKFKKGAVKEGIEDMFGSFKAK